MIEIDIPGIKKLSAEHLVLDYNGTLAEDGKLIPGAGDLLNRIAGQVEVHVITADTFGKAAAELDGVDCTINIIGPGNQQMAKADFIKDLGADRVIAIGNGFNDVLMLERAAIGIAVIQKEGASSKAIAASDITVTCIADALEFMLNPMRISATLRG